MAARKHRLLSGYLHRRGGRVVRPGEVVSLTETEAKAFGDRFEPVEPDQRPDPANPPEQKPSHLEVQSKGGGWYDVVNTATGQRVNSKSLTYDVAVQMTEEE